MLLLLLSPGENKQKNKLPQDVEVEELRQFFLQQPAAIGIDGVVVVVVVVVVVAVVDGGDVADLMQLLLLLLIAVVVVVEAGVVVVIVVVVVDVVVSVVHAVVVPSNDAVVTVFVVIVAVISKDVANKSDNSIDGSNSNETTATAINAVITFVCNIL